MTCMPLILPTGLFIPQTWSTASTATAGSGGVTVAIKRTLSGGDTTLSWVRSTGGSDNLFVGGTQTIRYMVFGTGGYFLVLTRDDSAGGVNFYVSVVDFSDPTLHSVQILFGAANSSSVADPIVQVSPGAGDAFLIYNSTGADLQNMGIYRSRDGKILCPGPGVFTPTGQTTAEWTGASLVIHYSSGGVSHDAPCPALPQGSVKAGTAVFPPGVIGGCATLAPSTAKFTLTNNGTDCLNVTAIGNAGAFQVTSTSPVLPAVLLVGASMTVNVQFNPTAVGMSTATLPITAVPAKGDAGIVCKATAHTAVAAISASISPASFGTIQVGFTGTATVTVTNVGEVGVNVSVAGAAVGSPFSWPTTAFFLACKNDHQTFAVTFKPATTGSFSDSISISSNAPTSPTHLNLSGAGCIPQPIMMPQAVAPIDFGEIEQGYRTIRFITVNDPGSGVLTFQAQIVGADPNSTLFALQNPSDTSITDTVAIANYAFAPTSPCGGVPGLGMVAVPVIFFANTAPSSTPITASLVLLNHNGTNVTPATYTYPLSATVKARTPVDAIMVFDHSGSMGDTLGSGRKVDAAVAAAQLFVELAQADVGNRLGLVSFNQLPTVIQAITPVTLSTPPTQQELVNAITVTALAPMGSTSIAAGVSTGIDQVRIPPVTPPAAAARKALVVLTDGLDNTAFNKGANHYSILGGTLVDPAGVMVATVPFPLPGADEMKIYGIGLGQGPDLGTAALDHLSASTGGYYGVVPVFSGPAFFNLEKYFTQIYMDLVSTAVISDPVYTILPGQTQQITFEVLRGDVHILIVVYDFDGKRLPFHLRAPNGETIDVTVLPPRYNLRAGFTKTARFMEVQVPLSEPDRYAGAWQFEITHPGRICYGSPIRGGGQAPRATKARIEQYYPGFVSGKCETSKNPVDYGIAIGVGSNLRMQPYVTPAPVTVGQPILMTAVITEAGLPVLNCIVVVSVTSPGGSSWSMTLIDDGSHQDGAAMDGEYAALFLHTTEPGTYQFKFQATGFSRDGKPVVREAVLAKYVSPIVPAPPGGTSGQSGPGGDACCKQLVRLLEAQNEILREIAAQR